jgi:hypothetical protein
VCKECSDEEWKIYKNLYLDKLDKQLNFKKIIYIFSPASILTRSASVFAGTDIDNYEYFFESARRYRKEYIQYFNQKGLFSHNSNLFFSQLKNDQIDPEQAAKRTAQYKNGMPLPQLNKLSCLDLNDAPIFKIYQSVFWEKIQNTIIDLLILITYCMFFLFLSIRSIQKYDVR